MYGIEADDALQDDDDGYGDIDKTNMQVSFFLLVSSAVASLIMVGAYFCQTSRAPRLLLWLFWSNFFWFAAQLVVYILKYWDKEEMKHESTCSYLTAFLSFFMNFSMLWPSVICFDLWMNTRDPRWRWDSFTSVERWYVCLVTIGSVIGPIAIALHPSKKYCDLTHYTPPTESFGIMIEFALPLLTFIFNLCVIFVVRRSLKQEMPFSVRTRRRRQMHNYVLVWMFCWGPYLVHEIYFFCQTHQERHDPTDTQNKLHHMLFLIRNATLYSTGSFDLLIFGMENAWLKRSLRMVCDSIRLTDLCCMEDVQASYLKNTNDKSVTFAPSVPQTSRAEVSKHYVTRRLSKPEKYRLHQSRPDLDPNRTLESLNPRPSADIKNIDRKFMKNVLDSRFIHSPKKGDIDSSNPSSQSSNPKSNPSNLNNGDAMTTQDIQRNSSSGGGGGGGIAGGVGRRSDDTMTSLQDQDESFDTRGPFAGRTSNSSSSQIPAQIPMATQIEEEVIGELSQPLVSNTKDNNYQASSPSSSDILKMEMMEAQEFGISPHKRGESLQRMHEDDIQDDYHDAEAQYSPPDSEIISPDPAILSPLLWTSTGAAAAQLDIPQSI